MPSSFRGRDNPKRLAENLPAELRWPPARGRRDPLTAMIRASGMGLQGLLHAEALDNGSPAELFHWTLDPTAAAESAVILTGSSQSSAV